MKRRTFRLLRQQNRPRRRGVSRLFAIGAAVAASTTIGGSGTVLAQSAPIARVSTESGTPVPDNEALRFDITTGLLRDVIRAFEAATRIRVTFEIDGIGELPSAGVSGRMTAAVALEHLLANTGVSFVFTRADAVTLQLGGLKDYVAVAGDPLSVSSPRYTQPLRDTPQTIVVIPQHVFDDQGATSLRDALRNTPGITLTAGEGGAAPGDNLVIRGFNARNDVYIDGARDPGVVNRDTFNTETVEVGKGPSSVTAGRGSTGGFVNLVTKKAQLVNSTSLRLTAGSADYRRGTVDLNHRIGDSHAIRLNAMWQDAGVPRRDDVTQKGWGFAPSVGVWLGRPTSLTVGYQHLQQNNMPDYGLPGTLPDVAVTAGKTVDDLDFSNFYGLRSRDHENITSDVVTTTVEHRFRPNLSARSLVRFGRNGLDRIVTSPRAASSGNAAADPGFDPAVAQIRRTDTKYQYRDDSTVASQTDVTMSVSTKGLAHGVVYKPVPRSTIYAAVSTSFNPSYDGSFGLTLAATGVNASALPPERSRNVEVGGKWDVTSSLFVTAALFETAKTNAKTTDLSGATVLAGDQRVRGVELGVSGRLTSRWDAFSGLSILNGRVEESGVVAEINKRLSYVPEISFNAWSTYQWLTGLTFGAGAQFTDGYFFTNTNVLASANAAAIQRLTRYWLFSAMPTQRIGSHATLQVNATNLANARYVDRGYTGHFIPGAGRAVMFGPVFTF